MTHAPAPESGIALIHYAMHFVNEHESGPHPLDCVHAVLASDEIAQQAGFAPHLLAPLLSDPAGVLGRLHDELVERESITPSTDRRDSRRALSDRETSIAVLRALTLPDADVFIADDISRPARVQARQTEICTIEGRAAIAYRRFDADRALAASGHYWRQFLSVLLEFLADEQSSRRMPALDELPDDARRILRLAGEYERELGERILGTPPTPELHIRRDVEDRILEMISGAPRTVIVRGEAGSGKSSVLWSLAGQIRSRRHTPVLISATWLIHGANGHRLLDAQDLLGQLVGMRDRSFRPVLLLDTADLLLHSENLILETLDLVTQLESAGIPLLITVRPVEERQLPAAWATMRIDLGGYSDTTELPRALGSLMRRYLPAHDHEGGTGLLEAAQTRGLPLLEVLRSPFLLRLLFELSAGVLPSTDLDVSALYERYWQLRIVSDQRSERYAEDVDLTAVAARLGILMLADASPAVTRQRVESALPRVEMPLPLPSGLSPSLDSLKHRGVLVGSMTEFRFAHQVLFEFIAAKALLIRDGASALAQLIAHIEDHPHDLFTGAVVEQLLILLARDVHTRRDASEVVSNLLRSPTASLRSIGMLGWCHVPGTPISHEIVETFDDDTIARLLGHLPQAARDEPDDLLVLLRRLWPAHRDHAHRAFVDCCVRLARRWPDQLSALVADLDIIGYLLSHQVASLGKPAPAFELLALIAPAQPEYARACILALLRSLPDAAGRVQLLRRVAEMWTALDAEDDFADEVVTAATATARSFPSQRRDIGVAAGEIVFLQVGRRRDLPPVVTDGEWETFAGRAFDRITSTSPTVREAAELHAIALHLSGLSAARYGHARHILNDLFAREASDGPPHIVGPFLVHILSRDSLSREMAVDLMRVALVDGLPTPSEQSNSRQRWAITVRAALADVATPPEVISAVVGGLLPDEPSLWRTPEYLLGALVPAALAKDERAAAVLHDVGRDARTLVPADGSPRASLDFLQQAPAYLDRDERVGQAILNVALATRRYGILTMLLSHAHGRAAAGTRLDDLVRVIEEGIDAKETSQLPAASLLRRLQQVGLIDPNTAAIAEHLAAVRDPLAKAMVTEMLPTSVEHRPHEAVSALGIVRAEVIDPLRSPARPAELTEAKQRLVDAAFTAYRTILAISGERSAWEPLWQLTCELPLKGRQIIETVRFDHIATYLRTYRDSSDDAVGTAERLLEVAIWTAATQTTKQGRRISEKLAPIARQLVHVSETTPRRTLARAAQQMPEHLGHAVIVSTIATGDHAFVQQLLDSGTLTGRLANAALDRLKGDREAGFQPMPWLIPGRR